MDVTEYKETQKELEQKADYYTKIDFPRIAESFKKAADALQKLIDIIEKLNQAWLA